MPPRRHASRRNQPAARMTTLTSPSSPRPGSPSRISTAWAARPASATACPLGTPRADHDALCIAEGRVEEHQIRPGVTLVVRPAGAPSLRSHVLHDAALLRHHHAAGPGARAARPPNDVPLVAHSGISALYGDSACMTGIHPAGQRLRSVNLSLSERGRRRRARQRDDLEGAALAGRPAAAALAGAEPSAAGHRAPAGLRLGPPLRNLLREGVGAQLLAHALASLDQAPPADQSLSQRDRQLLERVRERLHDAPGEDHTLEALAKLACMSPSTLRATPGRLPAIGVQPASGGWKWPASIWPRAGACSRPRISSAIATPPTSPRPSASATAWPQRTELNQRADAMAASSPSPPSVFPRFAVRFRRQPLLRRRHSDRSGAAWC